MIMLSKSTLSPIVDLGRVLAVTAIFYFHVGVNTHYPLSQYGHFAVGFFIVLAGLAYMCFSRTHVTNTGSYFRYFGDRLLALFPIFIIVNLLIFAASYVYPSGLGRPYNAVELILSSLGLSQYFGYRYLSVVMWFVPFILQVYLLLPLIEWLLSRIQPVIVLIAAFLFSFALTIPVCVYFPDKAEEICVNWSPIFRLPEVVLGVFLGMLFSQRARLPGGIVFFAVYIVASFCLLQSARYLSNSGSCFRAALGRFDSWRTDYCHSHFDVCRSKLVGSYPELPPFGQCFLPVFSDPRRGNPLSLWKVRH